MLAEGRDRQEHRPRGEIERPGRQVGALGRLLELPHQQRRAHQGVACGPVWNDARSAREALIDFQPEVVAQDLIGVAGSLRPEMAGEAPGADPRPPAAGEGPVEGGAVRGEGAAPRELAETGNELSVTRSVRHHLVADMVDGLRHRPDGDAWIHQRIERECLHVRTGLERHRDRRDLHDPVRLGIETRRLNVDDVDVGAQSSFSS